MHITNNILVKGKKLQSVSHGLEKSLPGQGVETKVPLEVCIGKDHSLEESFQGSCASNARVTALQEQFRKHSLKIPFDNQCNLRGVGEMCSL